jgi:hypothetical protein
MKMFPTNLKQLNFKIMQLRRSERKQAKIKLALQGVSGSGKTYSALLLAYGITNDWSKIALIDSEQGSGDLYAHLGQYNVITLQAPYTPEVYIEAIEICEEAGMELIILDSISPAWETLLDYHAGLQGNSFTNWSKVTPRQNAFIQKILNTNAHIISTLRCKQDYVLNQKDNRFVPEKVGLKSIQRDGVDYEFTIVFDIDIKHNATVSKDRTEIFSKKPGFVITSETGKKILDWCQSGVNVDMVRKQIQEAKTLEELNGIYHQHPEWYPLLTSDFMTKKADLQKPQISNIPVHNQPNLIRYGNNAIIPRQN